MRPGRGVEEHCLCRAGAARLLEGQLRQARHTRDCVQVHGMAGGERRMWRFHRGARLYLALGGATYGAA